MEETSGDNSKSFKPKPMAELLASLNGVPINSDTLTLTAKKQPRSTMAVTRTVEKVMRPMTLAEIQDVLISTDPKTVSCKKQPRTTMAIAKTVEKNMKPMTLAEILALSVQKPKTTSKVELQNRKKIWNSSVKMEKKFINHTKNEDTNHKSVRKVLSFPAKPKPTQTSIKPAKPNMETPKFSRPECKPKKSIHLGAANKVRISGVFHISETPQTSNKSINNRMTIANKENYQRNNFNKKPPLPKSHFTPLKSIIKKKVITPMLDTPMKSENSSDSSFLMKEKEINDIENKSNAANLMEHLKDVTPLVSTPFNGYRNVQEYFSGSSKNDSTELHDDTIMCFDKPSTKDNVKDESVIFALCAMFNKASVNSDDGRAELENLLDIEKRAEDNIKRLENAITELTKIKESEEKALQFVKKYIQEKNGVKTKENVNVRATIIVKNDKIDAATVANSNDITSIIDDKLKDISNTVNETKVDNDVSMERVSVIKSCTKSPSYKIPRKSLCLRKKVFHKSMPALDVKSPVDSGNKALNMYMEIKDSMPFLNSPGRNPRNIEVPDTPAVTSHNLQCQLDKLYNRS